MDVECKSNQKDYSSMICNKKANIKNSSLFKEKLNNVMAEIYELFELAREHNLSPVNEDGVTRYLEKHGKTCFQVSGQYDRPAEFLQTILDIIKVNYEPDVLGTFFLNSNIGFLFDNIPKSSFQLAYASITSVNNKQFKAFWNEDVLPYLKGCGYIIEDATAIFIVASTGQKRYEPDFALEIMTALDSGFTPDEAFSSISSAIKGEGSTLLKKHTYSGYCLDPVLGKKIRLSLWMFMRNRKHSLKLIV